MLLTHEPREVADATALQESWSQDLDAEKNSRSPSDPIHGQF